MAWSAMAGKWQVDRSENFDDYLKAMGANFMIRKMAASAKSVVEITVDGQSITIHALSSWMKQDPNTFIVDGPETETSFSGKKARAKCHWIDGKLVIDISPPLGGDSDIKKPQKVTRQIVGDELVQTMETEGVKCVRYYKRV